MKSRNPALDGIRALACLAVIGTHTGIPIFRGGWLGVDVFFVLSGWLITGILLTEAESREGIQLGRFYMRRAFRLYPALIVTVLLAMVFGRGQNHPVDAAIALAYLSDFVRSTGYGMGWLGHTWSLSVEEHFYMAWPIAMVVAWRFGRRRAIIWTAGAGTALSLVAMLIVDPPHLPMGALGYSSPMTRGWELLAGSLLASTTQAVCLSRWSRIGGGLIVPIVLTGAAIGAGPIVDLRRSVTPIVIVVATCWLLLAVKSGGRATSWLAVRPLPALGRISYGLYLIHPIMGAFLRNHIWQIRLPGMLLSSVAIATLSYVLIEGPIQEWAAKRRASPEAWPLSERERREMYGEHTDEFVRVFPGAGYAAPMKVNSFTVAPTQMDPRNDVHNPGAPESQGVT